MKVLVQFIENLGPKDTLIWTLPLIGTELGLGIFTAACNAKNIEEELNIDGFREGVTMLAGCGIPLELKEENLIEPNYTSYFIKRKIKK